MMDQGIKERLSRRDIWLRALYMVFFTLAFALAELLVWVLVFVQFLLVLFTGRANERLLQFGNDLSAYAYSVLRFLTFNTEEQPFPFADWPNNTVGDNPWTKEPEPTQASGDTWDRQGNPGDAGPGEQQDR